MSVSVSVSGPTQFVPVNVGPGWWLRADEGGGGGEEVAGGDPGPEPGQRTVAPPGVPGETQTLQAAQLVESGPGQVGQAVVLQERFVINLIVSLTALLTSSFSSSREAARPWNVLSPTVLSWQWERSTSLR